MNSLEISQGKLFILSGKVRENEFCKVVGTLKHKRRAFILFKGTDVIMSVPIKNSICDFLLVINTNLHLISYRFEVITDYCSNFGRKITAFELHPLWGFRGNVHCSS